MTILFQNARDFRAPFIVLYYGFRSTVMRTIDAAVLQALKMSTYLLCLFINQYLCVCYIKQTWSPGYAIGESQQVRDICKHMMQILKSSLKHIFLLYLFSRILFLASLDILWSIIYLLYLWFVLKLCINLLFYCFAKLKF